MLGLSYPGGPEIERISKGGDPDFVKFPRALIGKGFDFSFSGIKTSVLYYLKKQDQSFINERISDIAASFQKAVVEVLVEKSVRAAKEFDFDRIIVGGGVSANSVLRDDLISAGEKNDIKVNFPPKFLTTDNGAMIAAAGAYYLEKGISSPLNVNVYPNLGIGEEIPTDNG